MAIENLDLDLASLSRLIEVCKRTTSSNDRRNPQARPQDRCENLLQRRTWKSEASGICLPARRSRIWFQPLLSTLVPTTPSPHTFTQYSLFYLQTMSPSLPTYSKLSQVETYPSTSSSTPANLTTYTYYKEGQGQEVAIGRLYNSKAGQ